MNDNIEQGQGLVLPAKPRSVADINRFYYRKQSTVCKRSSLSLDVVLVELLVARFGSLAKLRKWIAAQAKVAQVEGADSKSISRAVQENAIRIIADPVLLVNLEDESRSEIERQSMMALWLGQNTKKSKKGAVSKGRL